MQGTGSCWGAAGVPGGSQRQLSLHPMLEAPTKRVDAGRCLQAGRGMDPSQPVVVRFKEPGALKGREIFWKP